MGRVRITGKSRILLTLAVLLPLAYIGSRRFRIFAYPVSLVDTWLSTANAILFKDLVRGLSMGTALFIGILLVFPIFMRDVNTRAYFKNTLQGIVSAFIFFVSNALYGFFEEIGRFYLVIAVASVTIITLFLIRFASRVFRDPKERVEFRTNYISSITAGLVFGVLLRIVLIAFDSFANVARVAGIL